VLDGVFNELDLAFALLFVMLLLNRGDLLRLAPLLETFNRPEKMIAVKYLCKHKLLVGRLVLP